MRKKGNVLVVENDLAVVDGICEVLVDEYELHHAQSALQAAEVLRKFSIDTVILEPCLPGVQGSDLLALLRRATPRARFIIVTGQPLSRWFDDGVREEVYDYLPKPFLPRELVRTVRRSMLRAEHHLVREELQQVG